MGAFCEVRGTGGPGKKPAWTKVLAAGRQGLEKGGRKTRRGVWAGARRGPQRVGFMCQQAVPCETQITALRLGKLCLRLPSRAVVVAAKC